MSRLLSAAILIVYVTATGTVAGPLSALKMLLAMLLPLACIWFPDAMGDYTDQLRLSHVNRPSPPSLVWFFGWVLLLLPMMVGTFLWLQGTRLDDLL